MKDIEKFLVDEMVHKRKIPREQVTLLTCLTSDTFARVVVQKKLFIGTWRILRVDANMVDGEFKTTARVIFPTPVS